MAEFAVDAVNDEGAGIVGPSVVLEDVAEDVAADAESK